MSKNSGFTAHQNVFGDKQTIPIEEKFIVKKKLKKPDEVVEKKNILTKIKGVIAYYVSMNSGDVEQRRNVEIYQLIGDIITPLSGCVNKFSTTHKGDFVLIIDDSVWIQDNCIDAKEQYAHAGYSPEFVRINTVLFKKI